MNAGAAGMLQCARSAFHIQRAGARQSRHGHPGKLTADGVHGFEIAVRRDGKASFENVHAELHQFAAMRSLLGYRHAAARRLFAVAQRGVKDLYAVAHV